MEGLSLENELELAERAKTEDAAFTELYDFYFPKVWGFVIRRVGHKETAEDLVSTVFLKVVEALPRYKPTAPFGAWVFRIAANVVIDHYRASGKKTHLELEMVMEVPAAGRLPDEVAAMKAELAVIERAMCQLPDRDQRVLHLKFFAEMSNQEIGEAEGCDANHAGVLVHRALEKARTICKTYERT
jgi:RNA polymerase sigma-70 factor (ECF subfamily)